MTEPVQIADEHETRVERKAREARDLQRKRERLVLAAFWVALAAGIGALMLFAWSGTGKPATSGTFSLGFLVAGAAALVGALLGFLFGLPRGAGEAAKAAQAVPQPGAGAANAAQGGAGAAAGAGAATTAAAAMSTGHGFVNNNLLEISDWLTKIIVGAGLVGLKDLVTWIWTLGGQIGKGVGLSDGAGPVFGAAVVTFFFAWGFLFVYIQTRTIISFIFASMERSLLDLSSTIEGAVADEVRKKVMPELDRLSALGR